MKLETRLVRRGLAKERHGACLRALVRCVILLIGASLVVPEFVPQLHSEGVLYVAGSGFDPAVSGRPIVWANGQLVYFTDQGRLGPLLAQVDADAFVADALSNWTSVSTAALTTSHGGTLAEDVNGTNFMRVNGALVIPADVQSSATSKPLAIIYDDDGQVTEALLGAGASDPALCTSNAVSGRADRFSTNGTFLHAFLIINGRCAQTQDDLTALKYRLVRKLGEILGLGLSQVNDNVRTGIPAPTSDDFAGFPVMQASDLLCVSANSGTCMGANQPRMDDRAALSRLYPVTAQNLAQFPGKQLFAESTIRVRGKINFSALHGTVGPAMQGVNVVARLVDPATGQSSRRSVASSVSGYLFHGNAGNVITGFVSSGGIRFDAFGSADPSVEGYYELAGLEVQAGSSTATYQITLEAVNPLYTKEQAVGSYLNPVTPSGTLSTQSVTLNGLVPGSDVVHDFAIADTARIADDTFDPNDFTSPAAIPANGEWWGSLGRYGEADFFNIPVQANRTLDFSITALDEAFRPSENKTRPALGVWLLSDAAGSQPRASASGFNSVMPARTSLGVNILQADTLKLGLADMRGDGRPDFLYHAQVLYADSASPAEIDAPGTLVTIKGVGFRRGMSVLIGGTSASVVSVRDNEMVVVAPALPNGSKNLVVRDPVSSAQSVMTGALTYGAPTGQRLLLILGSNPATPIGTDAPNPIRVRVVAADGTTPVPGVAVTFSATPPSLLAQCGSSSCSVTSDSSGEAMTVVSVRATGLNTVTAALSNGALVSASINGISSGLTVTAVKPVAFVVGGTQSLVPLLAKVTNAGAPVTGQSVNFMLVTGSGQLSSSSATSDAGGMVGVSFNTLGGTGSSGVVACLPSGSPCTQFSVQMVAGPSLHLNKVSSDKQTLTVGQSPQAVAVRVTDSSVPSNFVAGVPVAITTTVFPTTAAHPCRAARRLCHSQSTRILSASTTTINSDVNGLVSIIPAIQRRWGAVRVAVWATVGNAVQTFEIRVIGP